MRTRTSTGSATGGLFREIERGHLRIVDRVKDIYKNNRGQTIAPRKVEALFTGVPGIRRTFLVGDGRAYNALLIVPDREAALRGLSGEERDYFQRLITQANLDLAPYERVVSFALLDRAFSREHGELTAKGSFQRRRIEENFRPVIDELYGRPQELAWNGLTILLPRWFHRDLGLLEGAIRVAQHGLVEPSSGRRLTIARGGAPDRVRVGDLEYTLAGSVLDLGAFVRQPLHWVGNPELTAFGPCKVGWDTALAAAEQVHLPERVAGDVRAPIPGATGELHDFDLLCQRALYGPDDDALDAVNELARQLTGAGHRVGGLIRRRLEALSNHPSAALRCHAYRVLVLDYPVPDYSRYLPAFVESGRSFLSPESIGAIAGLVEPRRLQALRRHMRDAQLLILDEPTAALDARAEFEVFQRFKDLSHGKTAVLISHRFSSVRMADRILVLADGRVEAMGTHEQLLAQRGRYAELFELQAAGYR